MLDSNLSVGGDSIVVTDGFYSKKTDEEIKEALRNIVDYTHNTQNQVYLEAKKRQMISDKSPSFLFDQIRSRIEGSCPKAHISTIDVSKVASLNGLAQFAPRSLMTLSLLLIIVGIFGILGGNDNSESYTIGYGDSLIYGILGIFCLVLAIGLFYKENGNSTLTIILLAIPMLLWYLMVFDDLSRNEKLTQALPAVFASLATLSVFFCIETIRYNKAIGQISSIIEESQVSLQTKYFQNWKNPKAAILFSASILTFVVGILLIMVFVALDVIILPLLGSTLAFLVTPYLWSIARRYAIISARELRRRDKRQPILYLRSFGDDTKKYSTLIERILPIFFPVVRFFMWNVTFEENLIKSASLYGPVVALSQPGQKLSPIGAARMETQEGTWKMTIGRLYGNSVAILAVIGKTSGLLWELDKLRKHDLLHKLILIVPPNDKHDLLERLEALYSQLPETRKFPFDFVLDNGLVMSFSGSKEPLLIISETRLRSDYYEAIRQAISYVVIPTGTKAG